MDAFVNDQKNSVERNGTKLDRAEVLCQRSEMEYVHVLQEGAAIASEESGVCDIAISADNNEDKMIAPQPKMLLRMWSWLNQHKFHHLL